jgi:hypothetical protein
MRDSHPGPVSLVTDEVAGSGQYQQQLVHDAVQPSPRRRRAPAAPASFFDADLAAGVAPALPGPQPSLQ